MIIYFFYILLYSASLPAMSHDSGFFSILSTYDSILEEETSLQSGNNHNETPLKSHDIQSFATDDTCQSTVQTPQPIISSFQASFPQIDRILSSALYNPDKGIDTAVQLIINKVNINDQNNPMQTSPLHFAAQTHAYKLGAILISLGAKINAQDIHGRTPLHIIALYSDPDDQTQMLAKMLLKEQANLLIKDVQGKTSAKIALESHKMYLYNLIEEEHKARLLH